MSSEIVFKIPSHDIDISSDNGYTKIQIKNQSDILLEFCGNTMLKSKGKLFFVSEDEMGFISNNDIHIESIGSKLFLNSRQCSIIEDKEKFIKYVDEEENITVIQEDESISLKKEVISLKDRLNKLEETVSKMYKKSLYI